MEEKIVEIGEYTVRIRLEEDVLEVVVLDALGGEIEGMLISDADEDGEDEDEDGEDFSEDEYDEDSDEGEGDDDDSHYDDDDYD